MFRQRKQKRLATVELNHSIITATKKGSLIDDISCHRSLLEAGLFFDKYVWFVIIVDVYSQITSDRFSMIIKIQLLCKEGNPFQA